MYLTNFNRNYQKYSELCLILYASHINKYLQKFKFTWRCISVVKYFPYMCEALGSIPGTENQTFSKHQLLISSIYSLSSLFVYMQQFSVQDWILVNVWCWDRIQASRNHQIIQWVVQDKKVHTCLVCYWPRFEPWYPTLSSETARDNP